MRRRPDARSFVFLTLMTVMAACADEAGRKTGSDATAAVCTDCQEACQLDRECPVGARCLDGRCVTDSDLPDVGGAGCERNGDCPDGFECRRDTRRCEPAEERGCDDDRDCFAGERCLEHYCRVPAPVADAALPDVSPPRDGGPPDVRIVPPDAAVITPDAAVITPDAAVIDLDALILPPDALILPPDALILPPDSVVLPPDALVLPPDALVLPPDALVLPPDALVLPPDALVLPPDATVPPPDALVPPPDAAIEDLRVIVPFDRALPDAAPPPPDMAPPPPDMAPPEPDVPIGPPPTPDRGLYDYTRIPLGGAEELRAVDFHPDGSYAVILQRTNIVHVLDWATQTAVRYDLKPGPGTNNIYWDDIAFDPAGGYALAVGTRISQNPAVREGVIYRFEDALWRQRDALMQVPITRVRAQAGQEFTGVEFPHGGAGPVHPGGHPILLAKSGQSGPNAFLRDFDPLTNDFGDFIVAQPLGYGAEDLAFVDNEFGEPGILVVGGTNGAGFFYYTEIAGFGEVRVNPGSNNVGNLFSTSAHPPGDYALTLNGGNAHLRRFEGALMNQSEDGPWFRQQNISYVRFQQEGQRALIYGGAFGNPMRAYVFEYRHDLYDCPVPFADCDLTDVSIPNFNAPPFSAVANTRLNDAGFRPDCDGGLLVGGYTDFQSSSAQLVKFQILNGRDCGP